MSTDIGAGVVSVKTGPGFDREETLILDPMLINVAIIKRALHFPANRPRTYERKVIKNVNRFAARSRFDV